MKKTLECFGYPVSQKKHCLFAGNPEAAFWITARGKNAGDVSCLLEMARTMPENQRHKVCFILHDRHPRGAQHQFVFRLDGIGSGDDLVMIPTAPLKKNRQKLTSLYSSCGYFGQKSLLVQEKPFVFCPAFPMGVTIRTQKKGTGALDETNVNLLRAALTNYICRSAAQ